MLFTPTTTSSKYEASLNRHYNHRMQLLARIPTARSESLLASPSTNSPECRSRRLSLDDGEALGDSSSAKREEEEEEEVESGRRQAESEKWEWEWVDHVRD